MHEIVYLQFGKLSNFIGTHFWNAQDSYSFEEANWSISWSPKPTKNTSDIRSGKTTTFYRPRVLIFDKRQNLGALQSTSLDAAYTRTSLPKSATWGGEVQVHAESKIPKSGYLSQLEPEEDLGAMPTGAESDSHQEKVEKEEDLQPPNASSVRYWSDFNHVYYSEQSIHPLPNASLSSNADGFRDEEIYSDITTWNDSVEAFQRYESQADLTEGSLRNMAEACDSLQAFQTISHIPSYGGFTTSLLLHIADEYPKVTKVDFDILGTFDDSLYSVLPTKKAAQMVVSNARFLHQVLRDNLTNLSVPLLPPNMWSPGPWKDHIRLETQSVYDTSAVYAAHIESITWPARRTRLGGMNERGLDLLVHSLDLNGSMPFSCLSGIFPFQEEEEVGVEHKLDMTLPLRKQSNDEEVVAEWSVIRGHERGSSVGNKIIMESIPYPLPLSHPQFFYQDAHLTSVGIYSSLAINPGFSKVLDKHIEKCLRLIRGGTMGLGEGDAVDEMREVVEGLKTCASMYVEQSKE